MQRFLSASLCIYTGMRPGEGDLVAECWASPSGYARVKMWQMLADFPSSCVHKASFQGTVFFWGLIIPSVV